MNFDNSVIFKNTKYNYCSQGIRELKFTLEYHKEKNKTDKFYLFDHRDALGRLREILLFTPASFSEFNRNHDKSIIALKKAPWSCYDEDLTNSNLQLLHLPNEKFISSSYVKRVLGYDTMTEGDSLRFFNYVAQSKIVVPDEFWPVLFLWLIDETNHYNGFNAVLNALFGRDISEEKRLENEPSDFNQFDRIMSDSFKLLVALTYDEAATIQGYNNDMYIYDAIGKPMTGFVKKVIRDEGWHFSKFASLTAKYYHNRLDELETVLYEISNLDGREYKRTFFLDHDPRMETQFNFDLKQAAVLTAKRVILSKVKKHKTNAFLS
jgi:hypothetical protein